ncbi:Vacuolar protein sorting-associated protein 35B [Salvia divinorum]|uniref:Vacuolar protein sorting-associated protein 35B n=1 Tax=Salvia divinorum TaxID=28513 RepID=A0ABD1FND0_SALDI
MYCTESCNVLMPALKDDIKDGERVLLCLKRSLRIANAAQQMTNVTRVSSGPVTLFVKILNNYLYFFEKENPQIAASVIQGLIELIKTEMQSDNTIANLVSDAFFTSTLRYIQFQKEKGGAMGKSTILLSCGMWMILLKCHDFSHKLQTWEDEVTIDFHIRGTEPFICNAVSSPLLFWTC